MAAPIAWADVTADPRYEKLSQEEKEESLGKWKSLVSDWATETYPEEEHKEVQAKIASRVEDALDDIRGRPGKFQDSVMRANAAVNDAVLGGAEKLGIAPAGLREDVADYNKQYENPRYDGKKPVEEVAGEKLDQDQTKEWETGSGHIEHPGFLKQAGYVLPTVISEIERHGSNVAAGALQALSKPPELIQNLQAGIEAKLPPEERIDPVAAQADIQSYVDPAVAALKEHREGADQSLGITPQADQEMSARITRGLTGGAVAMGEAMVGGIPLMAAAGAANAYHQVKENNGSDDEANRAMITSGLSLAVFGASNHVAAAGLARIIPQGASATRAYLTQAFGQSVGNELTSRVISAFEAGVKDGPEAAWTAFKVNDPGTIAANIGFGATGAAGAVNARTAKLVSDEVAKFHADRVVQTAKAGAEASPQLSTAAVEIAEATVPLEQATADRKRGAEHLAEQERLAEELDKAEKEAEQAAKKAEQEGATKEDKTAATEATEKVEEAKAAVEGLPVEGPPIAEVALVDEDGKTILARGPLEPGHAGAYYKASALADTVEKKDALLRAQITDEQHVFVDKDGNLLPREVAGKRAFFNGQADTDEPAQSHKVRPATEEAAAPVEAAVSPESRPDLAPPEAVAPDRPVDTSEPLVEPPPVETAPQDLHPSEDSHPILNERKIPELEDLKIQDGEGERVMVEGVEMLIPKERNAAEAWEETWNRKSLFEALLDCLT